MSSSAQLAIDYLYTRVGKTSGNADDMIAMYFPRWEGEKKREKEKKKKSQHTSPYVWLCQESCSQLLSTMAARSRWSVSCRISFPGFGELEPEAFSAVWVRHLSSWTELESRGLLEGGIVQTGALDVRVDDVQREPWGVNRMRRWYER